MHGFKCSISYQKVSYDKGGVYSRSRAEAGQKQRRSKAHSRQKDGQFSSTSPFQPFLRYRRKAKAKKKATKKEDQQVKARHMKTQTEEWLSNNTISYEITNVEEENCNEE